MPLHAKVSRSSHDHGYRDNPRIVEVLNRRWLREVYPGADVPVLLMVASQPEAIHRTYDLQVLTIWSLSSLLEAPDLAAG